MPRYAQRVEEFGTTIFAEINNLAEAHHAINLGQGRPDFDGPQAIIDAAAAALRDGRYNQYPPGLGILPLRQAIADHAARFYNQAIDPQRGVVVTCGASEAVFSAILGLVDPGDEVILIEPYFDTYLPAIRIAGGVPVYVPLRPPDWRFDPDALRAAFSERTRAIIVNTPHNPTGRVFDADELALIAELCQRYDTIVIADEVYEHIVYEGAQHSPIANLPGMFERTVCVSSAAKTYSFTGWKVGWAYGHPDLITGVWRIHQNVNYSVHHPSQVALAQALALDSSYYEELQAIYTRKRDLTMQALTAAGLKPMLPQGAFYIMADFSNVFAGNDLDFARFLIQEIGVACIPPSSFFCAEHRAIGQKTVRFSFCKEDDVLQAAGERLARLQARA